MAEEVFRALEDFVVVEALPSFVGVDVLPSFVVVSVSALFVARGNPRAGILVLSNHIFRTTL